MIITKKNNTDTKGYTKVLVPSQGETDHRDWITLLPDRRSLVSAILYFLSLKARNSVNFQPICKILVSKINLKAQEKGEVTVCPFSVSLFLVFKQTSNNFLRHPVCSSGYQNTEMWKMYMFT